MSVMIGVDPHKASHTAVVVDEGEVELARNRVRASAGQAEQLLGWAATFGQQRRWAVESANGWGYLLSQQLVAAGEVVLATSATWAVSRPGTSSPPTPAPPRSKSPLVGASCIGSHGAGTGD